MQRNGIEREGVEPNGDGKEWKGQTRKETKGKDEKVSVPGAALTLLA